MARPRNTSNTVVCREAIVINVGGHPAEYRTVKVWDKRREEHVDVALTEFDPVVEEDPGTPYAFKAGQRVHKTHPAVEANPGAFMSVEEAEQIFDDTFVDATAS